MKLILARHGNTFDSGDKVVWLGGKQDLPLTETGLQQASAFGQALAEAQVKLAAVYAAPLQRTKQFAERAGSFVGLAGKVILDERLREIDYGNWAGLSDQEIGQRFGTDEIENWTKLSQWPTAAKFSPDLAQVIKETRDFVGDVFQKYPKDNVLVVTSNGRLRYFLTLVEGEFDRRVKAGSFKVGTGNGCVLEVFAQGASLLAWNQPPVSLYASLQA